MPTASQLPVRQDIAVFQSTQQVVPISLGVNIIGMTVLAVARWMEVGEYEVAEIPSTVVSASLGNVSLVIPQSLPAGPAITWTLVTYEPSSEDPVAAAKTRRWGVINVVTPSTLTPDSPNYLKIEMVAGDEYTFQVNLGVDVTGQSLYAIASFVSAGEYESQLFGVSVLSAATGLVKVTISETASSQISNDPSAAWSLMAYGVGNANTLYRAGPIVCYSSPTTSSAGAGSGAGQIGSVFL
jgi:hypothetical protein